MPLKAADGRDRRLCCTIVVRLDTSRGGAAHVRLQFDNLTLNSDTRQLWLGEAEVHLSPKAFDLLVLLIERRPRAVAKAEIREYLWPGTFVSESNLPTLISEIRAAIGDRERERGFIRTLHSRGYAFHAPEAPDQQPSLEGAAPDRWLIGTTAEIALGVGENVLGREGTGVILLKSGTVSRRHVRITINERAAVVSACSSRSWRSPPAPAAASRR